MLSGCMQVGIVILEDHLDLNTDMETAVTRVTLRRAEPMDVAVSWIQELLSQVNGLPG